MSGLKTERRKTLEGEEEEDWIEEEGVETWETDDVETSEDNTYDHEKETTTARSGRCNGMRTRLQTRHLGSSRRLPSKASPHFSDEPLHAEQRVGVPGATGQTPAGPGKTVKTDASGAVIQSSVDDGRLRGELREPHVLERGDKVLPQGRRDFLRDSSKGHFAPGERREKARS